MKYKILAILLCLSMLVSAGGTAYCLASVDVTNHFETGIVDIELKEYQNVDGTETAYSDHQMVMPGSRISKIPRIKNDGVDCYVRTKIGFRGDIDLTREDLFGITQDWVLADDGYLYYKNILKTGDTVDVFQGLTIPTDLSDDCQGDMFYVDINADAIQSKNFTPKFNTSSPWGSVEILKCEKGQYDVSSFKKSDDQSFKIEYRGSSKQLLKNKDDFFMNFPYLMPGDRYDDEIVIDNNSAENIKLYFRNEAKDNSELLDKISLKITTVIDGKTATFFDGTLRAAKLSTNELLGTIPAGKKGTFKFEISVPGELNNAYTILDSYVKWIFSTEPIKGAASKDPNNPKMGDSMQIYLWLTMLTGSTVGLMIVIPAYKRDVQKNKIRVNYERKEGRQ